MKTFKLSDFVKGWFVGKFNPTILEADFEVAVKRYSAGSHEPLHHHKISPEITVIVEGEVEMNGVLYKKDDIILIQPNQSTDFKCLTDVTTVVVKTKSIPFDKYLD